MCRLKSWAAATAISPSTRCRGRDVRQALRISAAVLVGIALAPPVRAAAGQQEAARHEAAAPLIAAIRSGDRAAARTLIEQHANVNAAQADGSTALHWASYRDDLDAAAALIAAGAKTTAANDLGATPLWI